LGEKGLRGSGGGDPARILRSLKVFGRNPRRRGNGYGLTGVGV